MTRQVHSRTNKLPRRMRESKLTNVGERRGPEEAERIVVRPNHRDFRVHENSEPLISKSLASEASVERW